MGKGKGPMAGLRRSPGLGGGTGTATAHVGDGEFDPGSLQDGGIFGMDLSVPRQFSRPLPPPPLTPPTLSSTVFPFEDRRRSYAASISPALDRMFIHQPNPEYAAAAATTSTDAPSFSPQGATVLPRRRSYTKSVPIGIPVQAKPASASSSTDTMVTTASVSSRATFSPSSYPPTSPLLPPPPPSPPSDQSYGQTPPSAPPEYAFVGGPGGPGVFLAQHEIDLQGEILSVVDNVGHGWTRHTRVYGGGVCLACLAAAERHGGRQGGFYGDKVPLEDRR